MPTGNVMLRAARLLYLTLALVLLSSRAVVAQLPPQQALEALQARKDLDITLFASEPLVTNPTCIDVDAYGRVWVCEGQWYRKAAKTPPADKIKVLEDTDGDGRADKVTVFAEGLTVPMGICVAGDKVFVAEAPNIWVFEDKDGDLKADGPPRVLLTGFNGHNHDHGVHGLVIGPDHKLYITVGDKGFDVTGPDGRRASYRWGALLRCELDGTDLELLAVNFRNPYELAVDSFGNVWCSDNDRDGLRSVRVCWILEGGNYGWYGQPLLIRNPDGSYDPRYHWRVFRYGIVPYVMITGFGSPCGMTFYEGQWLPSDLRGQLLHADAGPRVVRCYHLERYGAGYRARAETIISGDRDAYFRPVDVCVGPDGSVFVADWYDQVVGGHAYNNPDQGRIYRIQPAGAVSRPRTVLPPFRSVDSALEALGSPNLAAQYLARKALLQAGLRAVEPLAVLARTSSPHVAARALWVLDRLGEPGQQKVLAYLNHRDPRFRELAVRILRRHGSRYAEELFRLTTDPDPAVRRELLLAAARLRGPAADRRVLELARQWDGADRFYLEAIGVAARQSAERREMLIRSLVRDKKRWGPREVILLRLLLGEQEAGKELLAALRAGRIAAAAEPLVVDAFGRTPDLGAGRVLVAFLADRRRSPESRARALEALRIGLGQHWAELREEKRLRDALAAALADDNLLRTACTLIAEQQLVTLRDELLGVARDPKRLTPSRVTAIQTLARLNAVEAAGPLTKLVYDAPDAVRAAAIRALVALGQYDGLKAYLTDPSLPVADRRRAVQTIVARSQGALWLLPLVQSGQLAKELGEAAVLAAIEHADVNVRTLYAPLASGIERPKPLGEVIRPEQILALPGDPERGRKLFEADGSAPCIRCHMVRGRGGDIGPDLSQIGRKYDKAAILDAILFPSKAVAPEFRTYLVLTRTGVVYAGFIRERSAKRVVLHTADGEVIALDADQIEAMRPLETSIMPEATIGSMTAQDAADLVAFLAGLKEETVAITGWWGVGPFGFREDDGFDHVYGPERDPGHVDLDRVYRGLGKRQLRWRPIGSMLFQGYRGLDVVRLCEQAGARDHHVVYYFAVGIDSERDQQATLLLGSDDGVKVWVNGELVHANHVHRAAAYGQDQVQVRLRRGRNIMLVKLEQQRAGAGLIAALAVEAGVQFVPPAPPDNAQAIAR